MYKVLGDRLNIQYSEKIWQEKTLANLSLASIAISDITNNLRINFGEFVANCRIRQSFAPPNFLLYGSI